MGNRNPWVELYLGQIAASSLQWKYDDITGKEFIETVEKILEKLVEKTLIVGEEE